MSNTAHIDATNIKETNMTYITKTLRSVQTDLENVIKILEGSKRNETLEFMEIRRRVYKAMHGVTDAICVEMINEGGDDEDDDEGDLSKIGIKRHSSAPKRMVNDALKD